jgi:hypothetical protein
MVTDYFDSSALVKAYAPERGSAGVQQQPDPTSGHVTFISQLALPEVFAALARKEREGTLTQAQARLLRQGFLQDFTSLFGLVVVNLDVLQLAAALTARHPLRGYDAVPLATALRVNAERVRNNLMPLVFVSADDRLCQAAQREGLTVENPNNYP